MRLAPLSLLAVLCALILPSPASAVVHTWKVSLSGTYSSESTVVDNEGGEDSRTPMTGPATESATPRTKKTSLVDVFRLGHGQPEFVLHDDRKPLWATGSITRSSDLARRDEPRGCFPGGTQATQDCGTRTFLSRVAFYPSATGRRFHGILIGLDQNGVFDVSGGGFESCILGAGLGGIPFFSNPKNEAEGLQPLAPVPTKKLYGARRRPFTVHGKLARSGGEDTGQGRSTWSYVFDFTLKLTPVR